jgi:tetratricopeptide (TPR) repeat protein
MDFRDPAHPTVFISYSHESREHEERVLDLANRLRADGIDAEIDQYVSGGFPPLGWPRWMEERIIRSDFTLLVCTEVYGKRIAREAPPGEGRGVIWEADLVYRLLYESDDFRRRAVPVLLHGGRPEHVPAPLRGDHIALEWRDGYEALLRRLRGHAAAQKPVLGASSTATRLLAKTSAWSAFDVPFVVPRELMSPYFTGRDDLLIRIADELAARHRSALSGLGGVGKTQTAVAFAQRHRQNYPGGVFWANAETFGDLTAAFVGFAKTLQLSDAARNDEAEIVNAVLRWFDRERGWLLIFDNVEDARLVREFVSGDGGDVFATTRNSAVFELGISSPIELLEFTTDEAADFMVKRTGRQRQPATELTAMRTLADELGHFPLALEQAAAYVALNGSEFSHYLASYRKRRLDLLARSRDSVGGHRDGVETTWLTNIEAVELRSPASADVLRLSAFLHPDRIPLEVLSYGAPCLGNEIAKALDNPMDPLQLDELLTPLAQYSLIRRDRESGTYSVHRLVQEVTRASLNSATRSLWRSRAVRALMNALALLNPSDWSACEPFLPHALIATAETVDETLELDSVGWLLDTTAHHFVERGRYAEAQPLYERALSILEGSLGPDHLAVATTLDHFAGLLKRQARYADAEPLYERALAIRERLGTNHPAVLATVHNLAGLLDSQGRFAEAQLLLERAVDSCERSYGFQHPRLAIMLNSLAATFCSQGRYADAQPLYERALEIAEDSFSPDHPDVATIVNNLAVLFHSQRRYADARPLYERARSIREHALGADHPDLASTLDCFAGLLCAQGHYAEAQPIYERALRIFERALGPDHPDVATTLKGLANLFEVQGQHAEAQALNERARAIDERHGGH